MFLFTSSLIASWALRFARFVEPFGLPPRFRLFCGETGLSVGEFTIILSYAPVFGVFLLPCFTAGVNGGDGQQDTVGIRTGFAWKFHECFAAISARAIPDGVVDGDVFDEDRLRVSRSFDQDSQHSLGSPSDRASSLCGFI